MATVYAHIRQDKNEVFYVGISANDERPYDFKVRNKHWKSIKNKTEIKVVNLFLGVTFERAQQLETQLIAFFGRKDRNAGPLVNMTDGGEGVPGRIVTSETRARISRAHKGRKLPVEQIENMRRIRTGSKMTEQAKAKISKALAGKSKPHQVGRKQSPETIAKRFANVKNRVYKPWTQEQRDKMSEIKKGTKISEEAVLRGVLARKGFKHSEDTKKRFSEIGKQRKYSAETRAKMSESGKKRAPISEETREKLREKGRQFAQTEAGKEQYRRMTKLANIKRWT